MEIALFVVGLIADIWGIRSDNIEIQQYKEKQAIEKQVPKGYEGTLPELGKRLREERKNDTINAKKQ